MKKTLLLFILCTLLTVNTRYTLSQWYQQTVPVSNSITSIEFIDSLRGWACTDWNVGSTSHIISTSNGGVNWVTQFSLLGNKFTALDMIDINTGYVAGWNLTPGDAFVYKTTNGGLNWFNLNAAIGVDADDIFFVNSDSGYLCADFSVNVYTTTNGGLNWILRNNGITQHPARIFFLNYNTGFCGADGFLYKTTNEGQNWFVLYNAGSTAISSLLFLNEITGWIGITNNRIRHTTNSGINWTEQTLPVVGTTTDLFFFDSLKGFAGNRSLKILKTYNAGQLWGYQNDSGASYRISFIDTSKGWTGDFGIYTTTNSGGPVTYVGIINISNKTPALYSLSQNYPNPFNSQTQIRFSLTRPSYVKLKIYDILGKEKTLWENAGLLGTGTHELSFDAQNYSSGVYFYQLTVLNEQLSVAYRETKKMVLIK